MELRFQLVPHPPYSPDLASDYYLFPNMKKWLAGRRFYSNEEMIAETNAFCRVGPILLFGRDQHTGAVLDEVYKPKRRLKMKNKKGLFRKIK